VAIVDEYPSAPRVVVIADPSVGDPRPIQEGVEEFAAGDTDDLAYRTTRTLGNPMDEDRWAALNRAIDEINLVRPDLVLMSGDLTFAVHPRAMPYEYEDAWRILDRLEVPSFAAPGNHDLYDLDYLRAETGLYDEYVSDGKVEWQRYFGPLYYSVDVGPDLHLVSLDTFDWDDTRPFPPPDFDTLSGGRVGDEQLAWFEADLVGYRQRSPEAAVVTFAHHDPSWLARRHPWPERDNRDLVRELLAEHDVGVHFAGHTHEDRVARYHNPDGEAVGSIVETNGRQHLADQYPLRELHYLDWSEGDADPGTYTQDELAAILREPEHGPLFVTTTTAASGLIGEDWGLGGYWGWRLADLIPHPETGGYDPHDLGYAVDAPTDDVAAFLGEAAERPDHWNPEHAPLGVFSYPSHHLDLEVTGDGSGTAVATVTSDLLDDLTVTIRVAVASSDGEVEVSGGEAVGVRAGGGLADVWVRTVVPAGGVAEVTVQGDPR
jgi:3',5'-cyclic AMP phosphodiesterase CpdA